MSIKVGNRFRKDLGDIQTLANSIKEDGLLQSPLINNDSELVDGQRRIEACKILGWTEIPTYTLNIQDIVKGEFIANAVRKDFTTSEKITILEEIERRHIGHRYEKGGKLPPFQEQNKGKKIVILPPSIVV